MENPQETLEKLKKQNELLKQMVIETECEMDNIRLQAKQDIQYTRKILSSISPAFFRFFTANKADKFTQSHNGKDYTGIILIMDKIEKYINLAQNEICKIELENEGLRNDIFDKEKGIERASEKRNELEKKVVEMEKEKSDMVEEIRRLEENNLIFKKVQEELFPVSVLSILENYTK
ncbi:hypothetical protein SteCoe_39202 [Stentor coeruleus]|uniref:Uncharacterized protein n=1 Tax=Stentor coeruleus TaxID=5963 RepID=A0A1R2AKR9_9CILI|nr:hypothetical protein SteCoe_39202 [Stentor coeruleus]